MSFATQIIFGIILILIALYIVFYVIYPSSGNDDVLRHMTPLNEKKDILMSDVTKNKILGSAGSTVMGFLKFGAGDRTANYNDRFTPFLQVENNWFVEVSQAPTASNANTRAAARLRVKTNDGGAIKEEIIDLPEIPKQKWVFIAVLRDGRRFDVIYDNKLVASQRLENYPVVMSSPLSVGNKGLDGSVIHVIINGKRLSPTDVERERLAYIDTNNTVLEDNSIDMSFPSIKLFARCPSGLPCDPITKPPNNNLFQWKSPYA